MAMLVGIGCFVACGFAIDTAGTDGTDVQGGQSSSSDPSNATSSGGKNPNSGSGSSSSGNLPDPVEDLDAGPPKPTEPPCEPGIVRSCPGNDAGLGQCRDATQTCGADRKFGACIGMSVMPETCNGVDDDCDGVNDDPCPTGTVTFGAPRSASPAFGNAQGGSSPYDDICPAGEVLSGLVVRTSSYLRQIQGRCRKVSITENRGASPYSYSHSIVLGVTLPNHGNVNGTQQTAECPAGSVVVGASGRGGLLVDAITLRCAPLMLTQTSGPNPTFGFTLGNVTETNSIGGNGGSGIPAFTCPAGTVVNRIAGRTGDGVDHIIFGCATPAIPKKG